MRSTSYFAVFLKALIIVEVNAGPCNVNTERATSHVSATSEIDPDLASTGLSLGSSDTSSEISSETSSTVTIGDLGIPTTRSLSSSETTTTPEPSSSEQTLSVAASLSPTVSDSTSASSSFAQETTSAPSICESWTKFDPSPPRLTCYRTGTLISPEDYIITTLSDIHQQDPCQQACVDTQGCKAVMIDFDHGFNCNLLRSPLRSFSVTNQGGGAYWDVGCFGCSGVSTSRTSKTCTSVTEVRPRPAGAVCYKTGTLLSRDQVVITTLPGITEQGACNLACDNTEGCYAAMVDFNHGYACGLLRSSVRDLVVTNTYGAAYWGCNMF
ncbi:hypothetical protein AK830_g2033 [Neonectria ditissima]|uniref:Apple domain-containing protein n=1 Tax=Neonectria ditissima TaxID=78410 RepID=A0A0P7BGX9_9HYPO|nr:hypothetical protein AK830_g2033 [Neonectria ditissima]